jgi:chromosome segregation protein
LLRLGDVLAEIEKQVVQLRRQAKRARRYSARKDDLKQIELTLAAALLFQSQENYKNLRDQKQVLELEIESSVAEIDKLEINIQNLKLNLSEQESDASRLRQEESEISLKAAEIESEIKLNRQRIDSSGEEIEKKKTDIVGLRNRIGNLRGEIADKENRLKETGDQKAGLSGETETLENRLSELMEEYSSAEKELDSKKSGYNDIAEKISGLRAERASLDEMKKSLGGKVEEINRSARDFDTIKDENHDDIITLEKRREDIKGRIEILKARQKKIAEEFSASEESSASLRDQLSIKKEEFSGLRARKELLEQLIESGEGYSGGAKYLIAWDKRPEGVLMPVAEVLDVPEEYRIAVNAALGDMGEIIPARTHNDAMTAIEYLKANNAGRSTFVVLNKLETSNDSENRPRAASGFIAYLDELVSYPDEYRSAVKLLLGRVALFDSENSALTVNGEWKYYTRVTSEGLVLLPSAMISGGKSVGGIFGRRSDLQEIKENLERLSSEIGGMEIRLQKELENLGRLRGDSEESRKELAHFEADKNSLDSELAQMNFDFRQKENEYSAAVNEVSELRNDIERYETRIAALDEEISSLDGKIRNNSADVSRAMEFVEGLQSKVKEVESELTRIRIRAVEIDGLIANIKSEIEHASEICEEAEKMILAHKDGIAAAERVIDKAGKSNEDLKKKLEEQFAERSEAKDRLLQMEGLISEKMTEIGELDRQLLEKRKSKEKALSTLHNLDMELMELESSRKSITERVNYEFGVTAVEPAELDDGESIDSLKQQTEKIRGELQRMEPVNLMAAEDYERENDRYNFLIRQREDLLEAKASLKEAINRINTTAEERFIKTFDAIERNYQRVFSKLFENGEAHVELEDPMFPLESPIKILARPGGKKLLSVAQLSGGERALTAISLLFAIYLVKPSPFCILDEVDAPLDDINLLRFLQLIKGFAKDTQFIVITHNKLTMEASDILYGVTMENPGVSKVVSVKYGGGNGDGDNG